MVDVVLTDEAADWLEGLDESDRESAARVINLLEQFGVSLRFPHCSEIKASLKYPIRELRVGGSPLRMLYLFDVTREAVILVGGNKSGNEKRWYVDAVAKAEKIWEQYLKEQGR